MKSLVRFVLMFLLLFVVNSSVYSQGVWQKGGEYTKYSGTWSDGKKDVVIYIGDKASTIDIRYDNKSECLTKFHRYRADDFQFTFHYFIKDNFFDTEIERDVEAFITEFDKEHIILEITQQNGYMNERKKLRLCLTKKEKQTK